MYTNVDDHDSLEKMADMVVVNVRHDFTEIELKQESEMMAQAVSDKQSAENEKKVAMAAFKNKIDTFDGKIKNHASNINHGFTYLDKAASMYRDFDKQKRVYFDKQTGDFIKEEGFHPSDFQKKLDFEAEEDCLRIEDEARQQQIEENNRVGDIAEGVNADDALFEPVDKVIVDKKVKHFKQIPREETFNPDKVQNDKDGTFRDQHGNIVPFDDELPE